MGHGLVVSSQFPLSRTRRDISNPHHLECLMREHTYRMRACFAILLAFSGKNRSHHQLA